MVVLVHGFCGDASSTWRNKETGFDLPAQLVKDLPDTYVYVFDYVSQFTRGASILSIAKHLAFDIEELAQRHKYKTVRFLAHSAGGIVVRQYVLRLQPHAIRVTHVMLLAVPNNGTEAAELSALVPQNRHVVELRSVDTANTYLESLNDDWNTAFRTRNRTRDILVYAAYEELPLSYTGDKVVKMSSAIQFADENRGFQRNHFDIAKPPDVKDYVYRWIAARLREPFEAATQQSPPPTPPQQAPPFTMASQARLRIISVTPLPLSVGKRAEAEVILQNAGGVKAETKIYYVSGLNRPTADQKPVDDPSEQVRVEGHLFDLLKQTIEQGSEYAYEIGPGAGRSLTQPGEVMSDEMIQKLKEGKYMLYFLGAFVYRDSQTGQTRYTTFCQSTFGEATRVFSCRKYNDENVISPWAF